MIRRNPLAILLPLFLATAAGSSLAAQRDSEPEVKLAPWSFREDFAHVIPGWLAYPLSQDVGYDPTLFLQSVDGSPALVRDVISHGQRLLRVGLMRPIEFHAGSSFSLRAVYAFEMSGKIENAQLVLGDTSGQRYSTALPIQSGVHDIRIHGRQLGLPAARTDVEFMMIEADVSASSAGNHNRITLRALELQADRPLVLPVLSPLIERSPVSEIAVSKTIVSAGQALGINLGQGPAALARVLDDKGTVVHRVIVPTSQERNIQVSAPGKPGVYRAEVVSGQAKSEFNFLALANVPGHPRVLLSSRRLDELQSARYSQVLKTIVSRRAGELRRSVTDDPSAGKSIQLLSTISVLPGLPEYFALMDGYGDAIAFNALDFRLNGNREALEAARLDLFAVCTWPTWTPPWFQAHGLHTYYEVGIFSQKAAFGYDLIADELLPQEKSTVADAFLKMSIEPTLYDYFLYDRLPIHASNHEAHSVGGAIAACVALYGDVPDWTEKFGPALAELTVTYERLLDGLFTGDGSESEPAGYEEFAMEGMSWGMAALHSIGIQPRGYEKMMQGYWWLNYAQVRPDMVLDSGDFNGSLKWHSGFAWGAEFARDLNLQAFYETAESRSIKSMVESTSSGQSMKEPPGLLDLLCCSHAAESSPAPPSRIFPGRGSAVLRSGWNPLDTVISIRVGPWFNHEHHDQGSFQVAANGEQLIGEAGYANYYQDPRYPDFFTQAPAHNTLVVDGDAFSQEDYDGRYWAALSTYAQFGRHSFGTGIDYLAANLAPAYRDGTQIERLKREFVFVKPDILIVHDRVEAAEPHVYSFFLHIPPAAQSGIKSNHATVQGANAFSTMAAAGDNVSWQIEQQPAPTIGNGDAEHHAAEPRQAYRLDSQRQKDTDFLVAMHFQKTGEEPANLQPVSTTTAQGFASPNGHTQVLFRSRPGPLTAKGLSTDGDVLVVEQQHDVDDVFAENLKSLQHGSTAIFSSSAATDVEIRESVPSMEVRLSCFGPTAITIHEQASHQEVRLDGQIVRGLKNDDSNLSFDHLAKGEHVVSIVH